MALAEGLGALGGGIAVLGGLGGEGGMGTYQDIVKLWQDLESPDFDTRQIAAAQLKQVAEVNPALYQATVPDGYQGIADSPDMRASQERALQGRERVSREGLPAEDKILANQAGQAVQGAHQRGVEAAIQNMAERGKLSGGSELAARIGAGQQSATLAGQLGADLQKLSIGNRQQALGQVGDVAGSIRGQDLTAQDRAAQIANRFNEFVSTLKNQALSQNAQNTQQARMANASTANDLAMRNAMNAQQMRIRGQEYPNQLAQQQFGNEVTKLGGLTQSMQQLAWAKDAEKAGRERAIAGIGTGIGAAGDFAGSYGTSSLLGGKKAGV